MRIPADAKERTAKVKLFGAFRLDQEDHTLWRDGNRIAMAPKVFDVLAYLVETVPKRGYRFVASVIDEIPPESNLSLSKSQEENPPKEKAVSEKLSPFEGEVAQATDAESSRSLAGKFWRPAIAAAIVLFATAALARHFRSPWPRANGRPPADASIVVLPFVDIGPAKDQEYFADGITEQLISDLAKVSGLRVVGQLSAFQFKGKNEDSLEIGRNLGVANVLEGSVRREGSRVRITAELINASDGFQIWTQTYDREMKDILAAQDELARSTTEALQLRLLGVNGQPIPSNSQNTNSEPYQAYLQAEYFRGRGRGKEDLEKALAYSAGLQS
jgi:TolB-like protein/DNA-binding winged helix-turn-helix (wHTH) protein